MAKVVPFLMFQDGKAEEAMDSYKLDSIVSELVYKPVKEIEDSYL